MAVTSVWRIRIKPCSHWLPEHFKWKEGSENRKKRCVVHWSNFYGRINGLSSLPRHAWERWREGKPVSPRQPVSQERDTSALVQFAVSQSVRNYEVTTVSDAGNHTWSLRGHFDIRQQQHEDSLLENFDNKTYQKNRLFLVRLFSCCWYYRRCNWWQTQVEQAPPLGLSWQFWLDSHLQGHTQNAHRRLLQLPLACHPIHIFIWLRHVSVLHWC